MPPKASKSTEDRAWAEGFEAYICRPKTPQGAGWLTFVEVRDKYEMGDDKTHNLLKELVDKGIMEKFVGLQKKANKAYRQVWYRPTALKDNKTL